MSFLVDAWHLSRAPHRYQRMPRTESDQWFQLNVAPVWGRHDKTFLGKEQVDTKVMHNVEHFFKELTSHKAGRHAEDVNTTTMFYPTVYHHSFWGLYALILKRGVVVAACRSLKVLTCGLCSFWDFSCLTLRRGCAPRRARLRPTLRQL